MITKVIYESSKNAQIEMTQRKKSVSNIKLQRLPMTSERWLASNYSPASLLKFSVWVKVIMTYSREILKLINYEPSSCFLRNFMKI